MTARIILALDPVTLQELIEYHRSRSRHTIVLSTAIKGSAPAPVFSDETRFHERAAELLEAAKRLPKHVDPYEQRIAEALARSADRSATRP